MPNEIHARYLAPLGTLMLVAGILLWNPLGIAMFGLGALLLAFSATSPEHGVLLTGPFPAWELTRAVRRQRLHLWWGLITLAVGLVIGVGYGLVYFNNYPRRGVSAVSSGVFLFVAFYVFLLVFSVVMTLLSYAVAEERDGKRLDFLLATDLRNREIIVGKLLGRWAVGLSYALPLLPLIIPLPILFGIDPDIILFTIGYAGFTLLSLSGLTVLSSVMSPTKKTAGVGMAIFVAPYILLTMGLEALRMYPGIWTWPGGSFTVGDLAEFINAGNPLIVFQKAITGSVVGLENQFREYAAIHTGAFLVSTLAAATILRSYSAKIADKTTAVGVDALAVPPVGERPLLWKERHFIPSAVQARRKRVVRLLGWLILAPGLLFIAATIDDLFGYAQKVKDLSRFYVPLLVWIFSVAGSRMGLEAIVRERDKDTLTPLLLTDYTPREILVEKLLGLFALFGRAWALIALIAVAAVVCGGMLWWTALLSIAMMVIVGTTLMIVGLHTSVVATSLEAASKTFGLKIMPFVIAPPLALIAIIAAPTMGTEGQWITAMAMIAGLVVYAIVGTLFWKHTLKRFERSVDPASESGPQLDHSAKP